MPILIYLGPSERENKRYVAKFISPTKTTHFGQKGGNTYIDGASKKTRENYLKRHKASGLEDWEDPLSAGALSRFLLWGSSRSFEKNLQEYMKKFGIEDSRKNKI